MIRHGEPAGYQAGCRETCCRAAKAREAKQRRIAVDRGQVYQVPCDRSRRKVQALMAQGWSAKAVATRIGVTQQAISRIMARDTIRVTTEARIDEAYLALEMRIPPDNEWTRRTKNAARKAGWLPPLAYEDIDAGVVAVVESPTSIRDRFDLEEVDAFLQYGDWKRPLSKHEKAEVVRRWVLDGRSEAELCRLTGWRPGRYRSPDTKEES